MLDSRRWQVAAATVAGLAVAALVVGLAQGGWPGDQRTVAVDDLADRHSRSPGPTEAVTREPTAGPSRSTSRFDEVRPYAGPPIPAVPAAAGVTASPTRQARVGSAVDSAADGPELVLSRVGGPTTTDIEIQNVGEVASAPGTVSFAVSDAAGHIILVDSSDPRVACSAGTCSLPPLAPMEWLTMELRVEVERCDSADGGADVVVTVPGDVDRDWWDWCSQAYDPEVELALAPALDGDRLDVHLHNRGPDRAGVVRIRWSLDWGVDARVEVVDAAGASVSCDAAECHAYDVPVGESVVTIRLRVTVAGCEQEQTGLWFDAWDPRGHPSEGTDAAMVLCEQGSTPPDLAVTLGPEGHGVYEVIVVNDSETTADHVTVAIEWPAGVEATMLSTHQQDHCDPSGCAFDWLNPHGSESVWYQLTGDGCGRITVRVGARNEQADGDNVASHDHC